MRIVALSGILMLAIVQAGCGSGSSETRLPTVPVKGKLFVDDKPFGNCVVILTPTDAASVDESKTKSVRPSTASVKDDGTFELGTYDKKDGAPLGSYKVTVSPPKQEPGAHPTMGVSMPVLEPSTVEIAKAADSKPIELEIKLKSTGETSSTMGGTMSTKSSP